MNIRYFSLLTVVSLLSIGVVAGCSNPCAGQTTSPSTTDTEVQTNPCASKTDPCASKTNPCASKTNPCASKTTSVGAPLAQELQGQPVVVDVYASWCAACENIAPTLAQLKQDYGEKVHFIVLDVSDKSTTAEAEATAQKLGLSKFLEANKSQTGMLTIIEPETGKILAQHRNNPNIADYQTVLDNALSQ